MRIESPRELIPHNKKGGPAVIQGRRDSSKFFSRSLSLSLDHSGQWMKPEPIELFYQFCEANITTDFESRFSDPVIGAGRLRMAV
jgi:hypothetical protein